MNSSSPNPKLPTWIFLASDLALIGAAVVIAAWAPHPLSNSAILWIVTCVALGAIVGLVPIVAYYERQKNETLDERQRALEALARTVGSSAEQISIATNGLNEIAELALKNLRMAEHLPHKLQDKIAEFQSQLAAAADSEKEELERELLSLRTTESERLEGVSQRIAKSAAEWAKLETATHQHLAAANEAVAKLAMGTANAIGKAQAAAEQALGQARVEASRALGETSGAATRTIETAKQAAIAEFEARLTAATTTIERVAAELARRLARLESASTHPANESASSNSPAVAPTAPPVVASETVPPAPASSAAAPAPASSAAAPAPTPDPMAQPPKRPRKIRREETMAATPSSDPSHATLPPASSEDSHARAQIAEPAATPAALPEEPLPVPTETIPEVTPVAPLTAEPFHHSSAAKSNGSSHLPHAAGESSAAELPASAGPARKRTARKAEAEEQELGLDLSPTSESEPASSSETVLTSDGATRLLVTAYIGIGNRLFIRGDGPGLSWEKGVPLQFVSIGKWRWETSDAQAPVRFKLYKNDDVECSALGDQSLDPGRQQEVTAAF